MTGLNAFTMPKWGIEMTEGVIGEWKVAEGQTFAKGDLLALIETDKITNEVEAESDGVMCRIVAAPGDTLPVGALLAVTSASAAAADDVDAFIAAFGGTPVPAAKPPPAPETKKPASARKSAKAKPPASIPVDANISPRARALCEMSGLSLTAIRGSGARGRITLQDVEQAAKPAQVPSIGAAVSIMPTVDEFDRVFASPLAKRIAAQEGLDLSGVRGSGPRGRIAKADVLELITKGAAGEAGEVGHDAGVRVAMMSPMRKAIARQLTLSKSSIPHFYLRMPVEVDALQSMRAAAKASTGSAPSINDYLIRACALALARSPDVNVQVHGEQIHYHASADIAVAVATERGLVTPVVRAADRKSVAEISAEVRQLSIRARDGKLRAEEFQGGTFTISNLGMFGIEQFDAIINPPQGAILAVGAAVRQPTERGFSLAFATRVHLSLSCDHRAIDGALAAAFMGELRKLIEAPERLTAVSA